LSDYCIVEYMYDDLGSLAFYTENFILLENSHTDSHQIFNTDASLNVTRNVKDLTVVPIGGNTYAYLDSEKAINYLTYDTAIIQTPINGYNVVMDKVRFHLVAGFELDRFKALLLSIKHSENNSINNVFANILVAPETINELVIFNPKPLFLGNALYDRYIDILVPSIKNINEEYRTAPVPSATFVAAITPTANGSSGFVYNNQISIGLAECERRQLLYTNVGETYDTFEVTNYFEAQLSQSNEFDNVGSYISEAIDGDFIEFYMTFNGSFPADFIGILNSRNPADDWIIIHQLSVFEQVGTAFLNTARFVFFQEDKFDEPNIFRPVLKNANEAVSMSIDYIMRLTNRRNGEQIIREGSYSQVSPKKYGKKLITIPLQDKPQSQRIYNKIIKKNFEATKLFIEPTARAPQDITSQVATVIQTEYVPIFFNSSNVSVSNASSLIKNTDSSEEVVFAQGKLRFILSPFDNVIKIKVYTKNSSSSKTVQVPLDLNVNSAKYRLIFETGSGKVAVDNVNNAVLENLSTGVMAFNVSKKDSESILQAAVRTVYLVSVGQDGTETLMYTGEWRKPTEQAEVNSAIAAAKEESNQAAQVQSALDQISSTVAANEAANSAKTNLEDARAVKSTAVSPVVNRFGISTPKSVSPVSTNAGKGK